MVLVETVALGYGLMSGQTPSNPGGLQFKIVVIPPAGKIANPDVDWSDWYQIKAKFGLRD